MANIPQSNRPGDVFVDDPYLVLRIDHSFTPCAHTEACMAIAEILMHPGFEPLTHVALETLHGEQPSSERLSADAIVAFMADERCDAVDLNTGRQLVAHARVTTGRNNHLYSADVAPCASIAVLPHEPALLAARIESFLALATVLHAVAGFITLEPGFGMASSLAIGSAQLPLERALLQPGMSERRVRERSAHALVYGTLDREIPGPEWGLFLSTEHLRQLSADRIEHAGAFVAVSRLGDDLVYLQLTDDPSDALRFDYDDRLDSARAVLAPILMDVSDVRVE